MDPQLSYNNGTTINEAEDPLLMKLPPGYKFIPEDVDLIDYYLRNKLAGFLIDSPRIKDVEVYKYPPQDLEKYYKFKGEKEMYFFTRRSKKYEEGSRPNRDVKNHDGMHLGFWKATGKEISVMNNNMEVGFKRTLVYYIGKQDKPKQHRGKQDKDKPKQEKSNESIKTNQKTNWIMQEFRIKDLTSSSATPLNLDDWVLCKIYEHQYGMKKSLMEGQTNKQVTISTSVSVVQCEPNQYHQTECMYSYLSPTMIDNDNSPVQFNQHHEVQQMQDFSSEYLMVPYQPNQYSEFQAEVSLPSNMIGSTQCQPNQYQYDAQQMQASSSSDMILMQQHQASLSSDMILMAQHQAYQHSQSQMEEDYYDPSQFINF